MDCGGFFPSSALGSMVVFLELLKCVPWCWQDIDGALALLFYLCQVKVVLPFEDIVPSSYAKDLFVQL